MVLRIRIRIRMCHRLCNVCTVDFHVVPLYLGILKTRKKCTWNVHSVSVTNCDCDCIRLHVSHTQKTHTQWHTLHSQKNRGLFTNAFVCVPHKHSRNITHAISPGYIFRGHNRAAHFALGCSWIRAKVLWYFFISLRALLPLKSAGAFRVSLVLVCDCAYYLPHISYVSSSRPDYNFPLELAINTAACDSMWTFESDCWHFYFEISHF